ncbi:dual oxidase maturation factor 1 [Tribolium madens]|uniref:dual oxidase maturation factor 1 n=1 Tax=Tribolium madens TaxID=41895 RepID=UPI001CF73CDB|nr:dual oxidase maturation factor 1 [Tribolium madens]XP_044270591.1 dual oxidase maturation factor 1 [Tribolium madens]XP_044270592.1 dual oxidase maturation factor 1 [Tribolium madens]
MKGWFDAFRYDGGPTLYSFNNRTAVTGDVTLITFLTIFSTLYVAFLIIFPGIRKERFTTFFAVTLSLFVGATILVTLFGSAWHVATASIISTYRAFSTEKVSSNIGVYVGLRHVNITLQASGNHNWTSDIDFNEQFLWINSDQMGDSFREAMIRGLPFPILTVAEYFTMGQEGLSWGGQYRAAGYYAIIMLWTSFSVWILMNLMLIVVPRYGAVLMTTCGFLLLATACGYFGLLPETPLVVHIEGSTLHFSFGWCYWLVLIAGSICLLAGVIITVLEIIFPHSFSTILEVDYDTPYDRHIIIEDSRGRRFQKKRSSNSKLEEPVGIGTKILRRLSSKTREEKPNDLISNSHIQNFELGAKSNWSYPHNQDIHRSISQESITSSRNLPTIHRVIPRPDKLQEVSMW